MPDNSTNQENNKTQFHINTDKIVHDRLEQESFHFSRRANHHMQWVLKTGRSKMSADVSDRARIQMAEQHLHELMDGIVAQAKSREETGTISFASVEIACREKVGRVWPF